MKLRGSVIKFSVFFWGYVLVIRRIFFTTNMTDFKEQRICIKFCFSLKKTAAETHRMLQEAFRDNATSQSKTFLWYKRFQGRMIICRRRWAFWTTVNKHNTGKHSKSLRGYPCRSSANYPRCLWDSRTVIWDRSMHFGIQFEHEMHFCEICAKTAEWQPESPSCFCLQGTQTTCQRWPQLHLQYHNRWQNMGVRLWPWD